MVKRSGRLSRKNGSMRANRLDVGSDNDKKGILGILDSAKDLVEDIPKKAEEFSHSEFASELIHLEKKPRLLSADELTHVETLVRSGVSNEDIAREFGWRVPTLERQIDMSRESLGML